MLHLIVKQLQLSETLNKIVGDIKRLEEEIGKGLMGRPPPPVMHNKSDLEKDIDGLKVSLHYRIQHPSKIAQNSITARYTRS